MGCKSDDDEQQTFMALHNQSLLQAYISEWVVQLCNSLPPETKIL
jgi:hypothetical protein